MKNEQAIFEYINQHSSVSIADISRQFDISIATVRRKLVALDKKGLIVRTHGGAKIINNNSSMFNFSLRVHTNPLEKKLIALKALPLIKEGDTIFLDGSTSTYFLAEYLGDFDNITVITNGIDTLSLLAGKGVRAISTGGVVSRENTSVLVGSQVVDFIKSINADICFFSCQSLSQDGIISDCYLDENYVRAEMIRHSAKSYFLCDSTKLDRTSAYTLCNANVVDGIISEKQLDDFFSR